MQSVQKGVKERKKFRADCESWGGEGWSKEGETEGDREAKVLEIRVIENFVTERRGGGIYTTFLGLFSRRKFSRRGTPLT